MYNFYVNFILLCPIASTVKLTLFHKMHSRVDRNQITERVAALKLLLVSELQEAGRRSYRLDGRVRFKAAEKLELRSSVERRLPPTPSQTHRYCTPHAPHTQYHG